MNHNPVNEMATAIVIRRHLKYARLIFVVAILLLGTTAVFAIEEVPLRVAMPDTVMFGPDQVAFNEAMMAFFASWRCTDAERLFVGLMHDELFDPTLMYREGSNE